MERQKHLRRGLQRQVQWGQNLFLIIIAVSLLNQLMLWMRVDYHFLLSAATPYYINWLAGQLGSTALTVFAIVATLGLYLLFAGCWFFFQRPEWLLTAICVYAIDTLLLIVLAMALLDNPLSCLLEILIHCVVLIALYPPLMACRRLARLHRQPQSDPRPRFNP